MVVPLLLLALTLVAVVLLGRALARGRLVWDPLAPPTATAPPTGLPGAPAAADVDGVRFDVAAVGYRVEDVDEELDRLGRRLAEQEAEISRLEGR